MREKKIKKIIKEKKETKKSNIYENKLWPENSHRNEKIQHNVYFNKILFIIT